MHSSYLPQEHNTTEQLNEPTSKPTTATQGQAGGRPTYFKSSSVNYKGETIHFTHFGGAAPSTDQYESYNRAGKMLGRKESYQGGPQNMMPPKSLPPGQTQSEVNWIPTAPLNTWGGGKWQYPLAHQPFTPTRPTLHQQEGDHLHQQNTITPQKTISQTSPMIQLHPPTEWMTKTYHQTTKDPTIINARHFQSKGMNQEISLLISMVAQKCPLTIWTATPTEL
jgi:hypothetical protein